MNPEDVAKLFPEMPLAALDELAADVAVHGLREPILRWRGAVVDGRHRQWACDATGSPPRYRDLPDETHELDVVARVVSANLHRRHLTDSQRVDLAEQLEGLGLSRRAAARVANVSHNALSNRDRRTTEQSNSGNELPPRPPTDPNDPAVQGELARQDEESDDAPHTTVVAAKATRDPLDRYYTPDEVALACVAALPEVDSPYPYVRVLEPSVGGGAFARACLARWGDDTHITGVDLDPDASGWGEVSLPLDGCLLEVALPDSDQVDLVVGNPPFRHAEAHARRILEQGYPVVALLLRLGFLATAKRREFWARFPVTELHVLRSRPSFVGQGTDMTDYGLFVWRSDGEPLPISWIDFTAEPADAGQDHGDSDA